MENPANELKGVVKKLTQGTPDEQQDAIYRYFAPGATFEHPFCRVPSFKNLHVPGVGEFDSRALITAIYKWQASPLPLLPVTLRSTVFADYKILSPRISLEVESCVFDEATNLAYVRIFQIFSIWFIPFHRAPVRLVTVLHLTPGAARSDEGRAPPPPYDAAQEKLHAVQEGAEPSYAAVTAGAASSSSSASQQQHEGQEQSAGPKRYYIQKQEDLYQVNEFVKFVSLQPGSAVASFLQLLATLLCLVGAIILGPFMRAMWPAAAGKAKGRGEKSA